MIRDANAFKKFFVNAATDIQFSIRYSENNLYNFLSSVDINSFFLNHTDEIEVKNIIFSLIFSEAIGPNITRTNSSY